MKFVTFSTNGQDRPGVLTADLSQVVDLSDDYADLLSLIRAGDAGLAVAKSRLDAPSRTHPLSDVMLRSPLPNPVRLRDCSVFEDHIQGGVAWAKRAGIADLSYIPDIWYAEPINYKGNHLAVAGPDEMINWPTGCEKLDYELEIAAVIGKTGKDIPRDAGLGHVFGLTIYNDLSQRDASLELSGRMGPAKSKDFDQGNVFGPWIATLDEFEDIYDLEMSASLNGTRMGGGNTSAMHHKWDRIVEHCSSRGETLHAGEIIGSGTVGGGTLMEFGRFAKPGDVVELTITGLGTLRNTLGRAN